MEQFFKNGKIKMFRSSLLLSFLVVSGFLSAGAANAACTSVPISGEYSLESSCTFSGTVNGVENGNIVVAEGTTLTINASQTLVWNPGYSVVINGTIAINKSGGQLRKAYIWMYDADSDDYPSTAGPVAAYTQPENGKRRAEFTNFTVITDIAYDYNDSDSNVYPGTLCNGPCTINSNDGSCGNLGSGVAAGGDLLSCSVTSEACSGTTVFKLSAADNAHAELAGQANYSYSVCCTGESLGNTCSGSYDTALKLSASTNAHGEKSTQANYGSSACLSTTYGSGQQNPSTITCDYATDCSTLGAHYTCLASISGDTNAHIGNCTAYSTKICCANTCP